MTTKAAQAGHDPSSIKAAQAGFQDHLARPSTVLTFLTSSVDTRPLANGHHEWARQSTPASGPPRSIFPRGTTAHGCLTADQCGNEHGDEKMTTKAAQAGHDPSSIYAAQARHDHLARPSTVLTFLTSSVDTRPLANVHHEWARQSTPASGPPRSIFPRATTAHGCLTNKQHKARPTTHLDLDKRVADINNTP